MSNGPPGELSWDFSGDEPSEPTLGESRGELPPHIQRIIAEEEAINTAMRSELALKGAPTTMRGALERASTRGGLQRSEHLVALLKGTYVPPEMLAELDKFLSDLNDLPAE